MNVMLKVMSERDVNNFAGQGEDAELPARERRSQQLLNMPGLHAGPRSPAGPTPSLEHPRAEVEALPVQRVRRRLCYPA